VETLTVNLTGNVRRARLHGREHFVADMVLLVPAVLNGSQGPLFYPEEEIAKRPGLWNGVPIVVGHPTENGVHVSARLPHVLERLGVGTVFNDRFEAGKRKAEGWFDAERTQRLAPVTHQKLLSGQPAELSTGLYTENQPVENGSHNGTPYGHIARNYLADHLAVLEDQRGACDNRMGCGVNVNEAADRLVRAAEQLTVNAGKLLGCPCGGTCAKCKPATKPSGLKEAVAAHNARSLPSKKADVSPEKACQILKDGEANGHPLTEAQRGMFGAICGKRKKPTGNLSLAVNAFCATGEGGGQDNSCSAHGTGGKGGPKLSKADREQIHATAEGYQRAHEARLGSQPREVKERIARVKADIAYLGTRLHEEHARPAWLRVQGEHLALKRIRQGKRIYEANATATGNLAAAVSDYLTS
jgi:hypothetical protein